MEHSRPTIVRSHSRTHTKLPTGSNKVTNASSPSLNPQTAGHFKRSKSSDSLASRRSQTKLTHLKPVRSHAKITSMRKAPSSTSIAVGDLTRPDAASQDTSIKGVHKKTTQKPQSKFHFKEDDDDYEDTDEDDKNMEITETPMEKEAGEKDMSKEDLLRPQVVRNNPAPPQISNETVVALSSPELPSEEPIVTATPVLNNRQKESSASSGPGSSDTIGSDNIVRSVFTDANSNANKSWVDLERLSLTKSPTPSNESNDVSRKPSRKGPQTRTQQRLWLQRQQSIDPNSPHDVFAHNSEDLIGERHGNGNILMMSSWATDENGIHLSYVQQREIDRISKGLRSIQKFVDPIVESVERCRTVRRGKSVGAQLVPTKRGGLRRDMTSQSISQSLPKRISSLSATTLTKLSDADMNDLKHSHSNKSRLSTGNAASNADSGTLPYLLSRMWNEGFQMDIEDDKENEVNKKSVSSNINVQAKVAAAHMQRPGGPIRLA